ncbi:MAG: hypothetical protein CM1200mP1_02420 [Candidatus Neomarinimicrobiota bacterium]|nr:MAG: hypothetical protein CM1200mP1_02420 [Candidatus Neomarinimicrobiota bacterium]
MQSFDDHRIAMAFIVLSIAAFGENMRLIIRNASISPYQGFLIKFEVMQS